MPGFSRFVCRVATLALLLSPASGWTQSDIVISGVVVDAATLAPVDQATIHVEGTALTAHSQADGGFTLRAVPYGAWTLIVERAGYHARRIEQVRIDEGLARNLHIELQPDPVHIQGLRSTAPAVASASIRRIELHGGRYAGKTLADVLATVPGIRVYGSADAPGGTRISLGGEPASRVAVLLDGLPLSGGADGAVDLEAIPKAAITAIEVRPGSQSLIGGDAAMGGAINLITAPPPSPRQLTVSSQAGPWGAFEQETNATMRSGSLHLSAGGEYGRRDDRYRYIDAATGASATRRNAGRNEGRMFARLTQSTRPTLELLGYGSRIERGAPGTIERPLTSAAATNKNARVQTSQAWAVGSQAALAVAGWYEFTSEYYNATAERVPFHTYIREHYLGARVGGEFDWLRGTLTLEGESRRRDLRGDDHQRPALAFGAQSRAEYALRARWRRTLGAWSVSGGVAVDADADNRPGWSPRADVSWRLLDGLHLGAGWGHSFRRPLLLSAFWKSDYYTQGNPDLRPERAVEWDLSARGRFRCLHADVRYFERDVTDIIVWDLRGAPPRYQPVNLAGARVIGREDHLAATAWDGRVTLDYTHIFTAGTDASGEFNYQGRTLVFMPRHTHDLIGDAQLGRWGVHAAAHWVGPRYTLRANTKSQPAYRRVDAAIRCAIRRGRPDLTIALRGENLTNEPIELLQGYPSPARALTLSLTVGLE
ncbi:MAG TPA: TonB-dependent receptor [bacterium]|nr:TonB-dependent receptor [bacterium]